MRTVFHARLAAIDEELLEMTRRVGAAMSRATQALLESDLGLAESVIAADAQLNAAAAAVEEAAFTVMAQQQPVAQDLRFLIAALSNSSSLERMGDLAVHVAKAARLRYPLPVAPSELQSVIVEMGDVAQRIITETGLALALRDVSMARRLREIDRSMDRLHREMFTIVLSPAWPYGVEAAVDITLLSRYYERFADYAVIIGDRLVHVVTGSIPPQHPPLVTPD